MPAAPSRRLLAAWLLIGVSLLLGACASQAPLPSTLPILDLPLQWHVQRQQAGHSQDWLLVLQQEGPALRWSLLDPMGLPLARQQLLDGRWHNDGLLPPNAEARELFAALLFALTPAAQLSTTYGAGDWRATPQPRRWPLQGTPRWQVEYQTPRQFQLRLADGLAYRLAPLSQEPAP